MMLMMLMIHDVNDVNDVNVFVNVFVNVLLMMLLVILMMLMVMLVMFQWLIQILIASNIINVTIVSEKKHVYNLYILVDEINMYFKFHIQYSKHLNSCWQIPVSIIDAI